MNTLKNIRKEIEDNLGIYIPVALLILLIVGVIGFYWSNFNHLKPSTSPEDWGPFGDYIGGLLNPIITGFTLIFVIKALRQTEIEIKNSQEMIVLSKETLELSIKEMKESRKEITDMKKIQIDLAEIEKSNLNTRRINENQKIYEEELKTIVNEIEGNLQLNNITTTKGHRSFNQYFNDFIPLTLKREHENTIAVTHLERAIKLAISLCEHLSYEVLLNDNPNKESIIWMKKTEASSFLNKLVRLTVTTLVEGNAGNDFNPITLLEYNRDFQLASDALASAIKRADIDLVNPIAKAA